MKITIELRFNNFTAFGCGFIAVGIICAAIYWIIKLVSFTWNNLLYTGDDKIMFVLFIIAVIGGFLFVAMENSVHNKDNK